MERYQFRTTFNILGFCTVSGILRTRKKPVGNPWTTNTTYATPIFRTTMGSFFQIQFDYKTTGNKTALAFLHGAVCCDVFGCGVSPYKMIKLTQATKYTEEMKLNQTHSQIERAENFKYLGVILNEYNNYQTYQKE